MSYFISIILWALRLDMFMNSRSRDFISDITKLAEQSSGSIGQFQCIKTC